MMRSRFRFRYSGAVGLLAAVLLAAIPVSAGADTLVVPNALAGTEGDTNNQALDANRPPLPVGTGDSRIQQIYTADQFGGSR